ncbi:DUF4167 domain-containing protein [Paracoccus pantotrophus]|uniref:DUF4167 domain-containing protein n=1 Tax=Paracoccus pantotrophus TaxID=82367 RepID=A0A7H9BV37_PARPN|nr:DUF4167 domain-containing protein [Paracoccus pantotrophus]QLH14859.1 DUF4167 domain-containing protein [Paracoccus pantotrophus]
MNQHRPQQHFRPGQRRSSNIGSIVNRVYESSGPAGKFRGTAQQLVSIWLHHAREAQLRNDRVAMEACLQYAEHYRRTMNRIMEGIGETRPDQGR